MSYKNIVSYNNKCSESAIKAVQHLLWSIPVDSSINNNDDQQERLSVFGATHVCLFVSAVFFW